ncbi:MoaD/ThiS family protein [Pseudodonghicola flavimaris]|uniref:MoaD/ThiS family protein n=1 Tax=Pseudodonghicola flavimaris TaxID=3050036 RepID=A0ABT7F4T9_9RHOB|nr:MoaD/ThiS family protein [Pseudodonghicola flavimaris]MDK3019505.1 MoaD/ThiS family protein [Pseudodonghicola flavimaris]
MVDVALWSGLRPLVGGQDSIAVEGRTVGQILDSIRRNYPALAPTLDAGVSVVVDGRVIASSLTEPVGENSEVVLMMRLKGG